MSNISDFSKNANYKFAHLVILSIITFLAFSNTLNNDFVWDDNAFIVNNPYIKNAEYIPDYFTKDNWALAQPRYPSGYLRPFYHLSLFIDYSLWGLKAFGFHLTNLLLHLSCVILLYCLALRIFKKSFLSFLCALIFALHPAHVESVACISCRVDIQATLFGLLSLIFFIKSSLTNQKFKNLNIVFASIFFLFALLSKEIAIVIPGLALLLDLTFNKFSNFKSFVRKYFAYAAVFLFYAVLRLMVFSGALFTRRPNLNINLQLDGLYYKALTIIQTLAGYIKLLVIPLNLSAGRMLDQQTAIFHFNSLVLLLFLVIIFFAYKRNRVIFFSCLWFIIGMFPYLNILPIGAIFAERELYLGSIGFCFLLTELFRIVLNKKSSFNRFFSSNLIILICGLLISGFYLQRTLIRNYDWKNEITLWKSTIKHNPRNITARLNLGGVYFQVGLLEEAKTQFLRCLEINPHDPRAHYNLGTIFAKEGYYDTAIEKFKESLQYPPAEARFFNGLGRIYKLKGDYKNAIEAFNSALTIDKENIDSIVDLSLAYLDLKEYDSALKYINLAIEIDATNAVYHYLKGEILIKFEKKDLALKSFKKAFALNPSLIKIIPER